MADVAVDDSHLEAIAEQLDALTAARGALRAAQAESVEPAPRGA